MDIVAVRVTLNAGGSSGWHSHPGGGMTIVVQGQAFIERPGEVVDAVNTGATNTIMVVTFPSVPVGGASRTDRNNPGTCGI
jgi:quercetin dioxygenase-like cupin family protein